MNLPHRNHYEDDYHVIQDPYIVFISHSSITFRWYASVYRSDEPGKAGSAHVRHTFVKNMSSVSHSGVWEKVRCFLLFLRYAKQALADKDRA